MNPELSFVVIIFQKQKRTSFRYTKYYTYILRNKYFYVLILNNDYVKGPTKKVRGKTRGVNADKVFSQLNSKLPVTLTEQNGRPTGPYAEMFANEIGYTIRNHAPLNVEKWKKINEVDVDNMIKRMQVSDDLFF